MAIYLYCRISKRTQNIERQKRNLKEAFPDGIIIEEAYTGTTAARPAWTRIFKKAAPGDTIAVDSVSRMSRNAEEGMEIYEELYNRGVNLVFLKEPYVNTDNYRKSLQEIGLYGDEIADEYIKATNRVLIILAKRQVRQAFEQSEKEVRDLQQRTREGLQTARLNGKHPGVKKGQKFETSKSKAAKKKIIELSRDFEGSNTDDEVRAIIGVARGTYYKYKREIREAREAAAAAEVAAILAEP